MMVVVTRQGWGKFLAMINNKYFGLICHFHFVGPPCRPIEECSERAIHSHLVSVVSIVDIEYIASRANYHLSFIHPHCFRSTTVLKMSVGWESAESTTVHNIIASSTQPCVRVTVKDYGKG